MPKKVRPQHWITSKIMFALAPENAITSVRTLSSILYFWIHDLYLNSFIWEIWWHSALCPLCGRIALSFYAAGFSEVLFPFSNVLTTLCSFQLPNDSWESQTRARSSNVWLSNMCRDMCREEALYFQNCTHCSRPWNTQSV